MLLEMVEGRHVGPSRWPAGAAAVSGLALALTGVARSRRRRDPR
jgi:hypothetical protein